MPIYTRTGDKGKTSLFDGTRVSKFHPRVNTYGTIDELNSIIGSVLAHLPARHRLVKKELEKIQHELFDIGSALATPHPLPVTGLENRPAEFEKLIDVMTGKMPELKAFILPGGSKAGSLIHVARTVVRRVERQLVELMETDEVDKTVVVYLNRLSDLLFTMARFVNHLEKKKEIKWIKK
jgi:cob(I)alamin adenosyltransferase